MNDLRNLYEEVILDHNRNPRNYNRIPVDANRKAVGDNPLCGDSYTLHLSVQEGKIQAVGFEGAGCAISKASASLMSQAILGKTEKEAGLLFQQVHDLLTQENTRTEDFLTIGKLKVLSGVRDFPMRVKCATLAWHILKAALAQVEEPVSTEK